MAITFTAAAEQTTQRRTLAALTIVLDFELGSTLWSAPPWPGLEPYFFYRSSLHVDRADVMTTTT
jgi:hypothetical protein